MKHILFLIFILSSCISLRAYADNTYFDNLSQREELNRTMYRDYEQSITTVSGVERTKQLDILKRIENESERVSMKKLHS
jgi:hypothetical protein